MADWVDTLFSAEVLAIAIPAIIFGLTLILVVRRLVGFVVTLTLLSFALLSGLAIINHDVVRDYVRGEYSEQEVQTWKGQVSGELQRMWDVLKDLKDLMIRQEGDERNTSAVLGRLDKRIQNIESLMNERHPLTSSQRPSQPAASYISEIPSSPSESSSLAPEQG